MREALLARHARRAAGNRQKIGPQQRGQARRRQPVPGGRKTAAQQREHEGRRPQLPQGHHPFDLAYHQGLEIAVLIIHAPQLGQRISRVIVGNDARREQDPSALLQQPQIELVVLVAAPALRRSSRCGRTPRGDNSRRGPYRPTAARSDRCGSRSCPRPTDATCRWRSPANGRLAHRAA